MIFVKNPQLRTTIDGLEQFDKKNTIPAFFP